MVLLMARLIDTRNESYVHRVLFKLNENVRPRNTTMTPWSHNSHLAIFISVQQLYTHQYETMWSMRFAFCCHFFHFFVTKELTFITLWCTLYTFTTRRRRKKHQLMDLGKSQSVNCVNNVYSCQYVHVVTVRPIEANASNWLRWWIHMVDYQYLHHNSRLRDWNAILCWICPDLEFNYLIFFSFRILCRAGWFFDSLQSSLSLFCME